MATFNPEVYAWAVLPLLVFGARVLDVSLSTLGITFIARERRKLAPLLGFFEVLIWIVVVSQIMQTLHSPLSFIAYAAGFATGNYVGIRHLSDAPTTFSCSPGTAQRDVGAGRAIGALRPINSDHQLLQNLYPATKGAQPR